MLFWTFNDTPYFRQCVRSDEVDEGSSEKPFTMAPYFNRKLLETLQVDSSFGCTRVKNGGVIFHLFTKDSIIHVGVAITQTGCHHSNRPNRSFQNPSVIPLWGKANKWRRVICCRINLQTYHPVCLKLPIE